MSNIFVFQVNDDDYQNDYQNNEHEAGQLLINQSAIQSGQIDRTNFGSIGHEVAPFLFLNDMTAVEAQRIRQSTELLESTREQVFLTEVQDIGFNPNEFVAMLFYDAEGRIQVPVVTTTPVAYFQIPIWALIVGGITAFTVLVTLAVVLGQKMAGVIHKNKVNEDNTDLEVV